MSVFDLMGAPFAECLVLVAIHTYLGIHVLKRRVIFVDLALAQIAALGTTVGFLFGILPDTQASLVFSILFACVGAGVFACTRVRGERVPQEAVIGLVYAICCAVAVLVVEKTKGAEHLQDILVGSLLWVGWSDVITATVVYAVIGAIHVAFRRQFFLISNDPDRAYAEGLRVRAWDFLFYLTFGLVISFSTRVAGVLLVFVFLVAPAILAFLITARTSLQLLLGWSLGTVVTVVGLYLSYVIDLPSGPTVVTLYGVALVIGAVLVHVWRSGRRGRALGRVGAGAVGVVLVGALIVGGGHLLARSPLARSNVAGATADEVARASSGGATAIHREHVTSGPGPASLAAAGGGTDTVPGGAEAVVPATLRPAVEPCLSDALLSRYRRLDDAEARLGVVEATQEADRPRALQLLLLVLADPATPPFFRGEAVSAVERLVGSTFSYDTTAEPAANATALGNLCRHLQQLPPRRDPS